MTYSPGQFQNIIPFVRQPPDWLILGGPADGDEAQCAVENWPFLSVIGIEPVQSLQNWQRQNGWPGRLLLPYALSDGCGNAVMRLPPEPTRCASLMPDRPGAPVDVSTVTLDYLSRVYGPFTRAILWLDIEGFEYEALCGAGGLFDAGAVLLVNVEILRRRAEATARIEQFFADRGFELAHTWNEQKSHEDRVYVPASSHR